MVSPHTPGHQWRCVHTGPAPAPTALSTLTKKEQAAIAAVAADPNSTVKDTALLNYARKAEADALQHKDASLPADVQKIDELTTVSCHLLCSVYSCASRT